MNDGQVDSIEFEFDPVKRCYCFGHEEERFGQGHEHIGIEECRYERLQAADLLGESEHRPEPVAIDRLDPRYHWIDLDVWMIVCDASVNDHERARWLVVTNRLRQNLTDL